LKILEARSAVSEVMDGKEEVSIKYFIYTLMQYEGDNSLQFA